MDHLLLHKGNMLGVSGGRLFFAARKEAVKSYATLVVPADGAHTTDCGVFVAI